MPELDETLIAFGDSIKAVEETDDSYKFGAFLVVFDSPDISNHRDSFTKSTDFGFEDGETRPILYNHGLDATVGKAVIGKGRLFLKDAGVWMEGEVKKRRDYLEKHIERVGEGLKATVKHRGIEAPMFGTSSGATSHTVIREAKGAGHVISQWHIGEASITPTPAEPQTACMSLKSLVEIESADEEVGEFKKYDPSQPRDEEGKWSVVSGHKVSITGRKVKEKDVTHARVNFDLSRETHAALLKGFQENKIQTDDHLFRAISHAQSAALRDGGKVTGAHIEAALASHGHRGASEGKRERPPTAEENTLPHLPAHRMAQEQFMATAKVETKSGKTSLISTPDGKRILVSNEQNLTGSAAESKKDAHRIAVERALQDGEGVSDHVLSDYRDLKQKYHGPPDAGDVGPLGDEKPEAVKPSKDPRSMSAKEINRELDKLSEHDSKLSAESIAASRGHEKPSDRTGKTDSLSIRRNAHDARVRELRNEVQRRTGNRYMTLTEGRGGFNKSDDGTEFFADETDFKSLEAHSTGMSFVDHFTVTLGSCEAFIDRALDFIELREGSRKSDRVLTPAKHAQLSEMFSGLKVNMERMEGLLDAHAPQNDSATESGNESEAETKVRLDSLLLDAELSLMAYSLEEMAMAAID